MARPGKENAERLERTGGRLYGAAAGEGAPGAGNRAEESAATGLPKGEWTERGVYRMEFELPYGEKYGSRLFENPRNRAGLLRPWGAEGYPVFLDLETTGLSGGAGVRAFLAGLGICGPGSFKVIQLFLSDPAWEDNWLTALERELPERFGFVTYNGAVFDMPLLRTRYTLSRRTPSWNGAPHLDLLLLARHFYRKRLLSCSLSSIEANVLGVLRSGEDIPGREIPAVYAEFLRTRDASGLNGVFYHNRLDIVSLAALQTKIGELVAMENCGGEDLVRCGDLWHITGRGGEARAAWLKALAYGDGVCGANLRFADQSRRAGDFESVKKYLELALEHDKHPLETLESLAKLEEHRFQNYGAALSYAERALLWLDSRRSLRDYKWSLERQGVKHRICRLKRKIACGEAKQTGSGTGGGVGGK